jgi:hypothetical protein
MLVLTGAWQIDKTTLAGACFPGYTYVRYFEISYQSLVLPAWFSNPAKRLVRVPKIHFMDQGVL